MDKEGSGLEPPKNFAFPFTPYDIQKDFMCSLYEAIEGRKLGIFESPTGTGKSMSLICGSLAWLLDHEERTKSDLKRNIARLNERLSSNLSDGNWLETHAARTKDKQKRDMLQIHLNKITSKEERQENMRVMAKNLCDEIKKFKTHKFEKWKKMENQLKTDSDCKNSDIENELLDDDDDYIIEDDLESKCDGSSSDDSENENEDPYYGVKIYFCSRTHSQLSQIAHEIQRSPYKDRNISVVTLSSRQNYCINDNVLKLKHLPLINEKCQELHGKKKMNVTKISQEGERIKKQKTSSGCLFYQQSNLENVKLKIITEIGDIEEISQIGKEFEGCPYYASRQAVPEAHIILVPYNTILHRNTRTTCGINLKDSVVIIDEAHNLLDAIANVHSSIVSGYQLMFSYSQLVQYRDRYHDKFSPINLLRLNQLIYIHKCFIQKLGLKIEVHPDSIIGEEKSITLETLAEFTLSCEIDTINLFKLLEFIKNSKLSHKLHGFASKHRPSVIIHRNKKEKGILSFLKNLERRTENEAMAEHGEYNVEYTEGNPLLAVIGFLESLTNHFEDGRIVCSRNRSARDSFMKFLLLNPASYFTDIVTEARSVILAGGTMQPLSEFTDQLFLMAGGIPERILTFTCGHVVHEENILPIVVTSGPSGKVLDFSYQHRSELQLIEELGRLLINVCNVVPEGIVCFFPSYEYENLVHQQLQKLNVISKLEIKKKVLREPRKANKAQDVLREYMKAAKHGAILFSIVGGKLSEGLNFSDELGRCVMVVGLPYPNLANPELKEKINYLNNRAKSNAGREYYENLCMKAVNQSIGRSIRHIDDYASVLLVDHRYSRNQCQSALPKWIAKRLCVESKFGAVMRLMGKFFASRKRSGNVLD